MKQTRREFFKTSAVGAGVLAAASRSRVLGANDRINVGIIGVGGMGMGHLRALVERADDYKCNVVAVCDVYRRRLNRAKEICGGDGYEDYRELLARPDIDAVWIVTPDHWHSKMSIDAMAAGKHVYCEKPMTLTVEQAFEVQAAVKEYGKVFQVGPNRTADDRFWKAQEFIKAGKLGKVTWAQGGYNRNVRGGAFNEWFQIDETAGPDKTGDDHINWEMWLGTEWKLAPEINWNPEHYFRFRKYWPYNGGVATDLLYHMLAPLLISIAGNNGEFPHRVNANGGLYLLKDGRDIPDVFLMNIDYSSEFTVNLTSVLTNNTPVPTRIYGQYGTIDIDPDADRAGQVGGGIKVSGNGDFVKEFREKNGGYSQLTIPTDERPDLRGNFLNCIRDGGTPFCNVDLGTATMVGIKLGVESYRQSKTMIWDAENRKVVG
ncbi:MAG: Gfo/Idh/MocA family oxidoreductase [Acidobacteriota bacterium]|nr:MAG: Gfo/Idh/MocA family oxidoreductase [Acidobacteriota bacterium]